jgi:hypothetical protein
VLERIEAMPAGTIGFKVVSELTGDDYKDQIEPALAAVAAEGDVRLLFEIDSGFGMDAGAVIEDAKTGLKLGLGHMKAWKRTAIVTDVEWIRKAIKAFGFMAPGELRVFPPAELGAAKVWVAE